MPINICNMRRKFKIRAGAFALALILPALSLGAEVAQASGLMRKFSNGKISVVVFASTHSRADADALASGRWDADISNADDVIFEQEINAYSLSRLPSLLAKPELMLSKEEAETIYARVKEAGRQLRADDLIGVRPLIASFRLLRMVWQGVTIPPGQAIEERLIVEAVDKRKSIFALETMQQFANAANGLSVLEERTLMTQAINFVVNPRFRDPLVAWGLTSGEMLREVNCDEFERRYSSLFLTSSALRDAYNKLIFGRNRALAARLLDLLDSRRSPSTVVVVGAAHVCGQDGIFESLRRAGFHDK